MIRSHFLFAESFWCCFEKSGSDAKVNTLKSGWTMNLIYYKLQITRVAQSCHLATKLNLF